jgi:predicted component of viral defense system (DUF524 family)
LKGSENALVFDAKYRLDSEESEPKGEDIDKMHTYRDAIRIGEDEHRFIRAAFILYPGTAARTYYSGRVGAIPLRPGSSLDEIRRVIVQNPLAHQSQ